MNNVIQATKNIVVNTVIVAGLIGIGFLGGATFNTKLDISFRVSQGAQAAEEDYHAKIDAPAVRLPETAVPKHKPEVTK